MHVNFNSNAGRQISAFGTREETDKAEPAAAASAVQSSGQADQVIISSFARQAARDKIDELIGERREAMENTGL